MGARHNSAMSTMDDNAFSCKDLHVIANVSYERPNVLRHLRDSTDDSVIGATASARRAAHSGVAKRCHGTTLRPAPI
jgi:hypothetical protein